MVRIVMDHGGIIDDYHGDMIKADFGIPLERKTEEEIRQDAVNGVQCALAMERELISLNRVWHVQHQAEARIRVGLSTGPVVMGSLGGTQRQKITTIGDTVNVAARLENYQKDNPEMWETGRVARIFLGDRTRELVDDVFSLARVGTTSLRGKQEYVTIYRVLSQVSPSK